MTLYPRVSSRWIMLSLENATKTAVNTNQLALVEKVRHPKAKCPDCTLRLTFGSGVRRVAHFETEKERDAAFEGLWWNL